MLSNKIKKYIVNVFEGCQKYYNNTNMCPVSQLERGWDKKLPIIEYPNTKM